MAAAEWKLNNEVAADTQGIVTSGYGRLEYGTALFLELPKGIGGAWLSTLPERVTPAIQTGGPEPVPHAVSVAFTWTGLAQMGLPEASLASFSAPFREGMLQVDRLRRLGDRRKGEWLETVIQNGPIWSGNTPHQKLRAEPKVYGVTQKTTEDKVDPTPKTVHAMLLVYAATETEVADLATQLDTALKPQGITVVHQLPLQLDVVEGKGFSREHFGFADGISQPIPYDAAGAVRLNDKPVTEPDKVHGVRLGEVLMGYENGHQEIAPRPVVSEENIDTPGGGNPKLLPPHDVAIGFRDLGKNGSYMVVRQLRQDVAAFWKGMDAAAKAAKKQDPNADHITPEWIAEKVVGRGKDGRGLKPGGRYENGPGNAIRNDFLFFHEDEYGQGCPLGSHVRRANPRDALAPKETMRQTLLDAANNHRILRRGRKYGPKQEDQHKDDGKERGLLFICLNTDIARQFEFTQQTWLMNSDFATLFEETDPLIGPDGGMTIPDDPLRRRVNVQTFVQLVGGEYFFLPSMPALDYLGSL